MEAALDKEAFVTVPSRAPGSFLEQCLMINQMHESSSPKFIGRSLNSKASGRVVAVVDRTAQVDSAAKEIFASRMQYSGQSRYAVDQVFVNEFVADEFLTALQKQFSTHAEALNETVNNSKYTRFTCSSKQSSQSQLVADSCQIVSSQGNARAVLVNSR
jgi:type IV pilus biogenesis protein CpaD/CtpE